MKVHIIQKFEIRDTILHQQMVSSKFSFKKVRREKKKNIYIFSQVAQVARGARERGRERKRNFIKFSFGCIPHATIERTT